MRMMKLQAQDRTLLCRTPRHAMALALVPVGKPSDEAA